MARLFGSQTQLHLQLKLTLELPAWEFSTTIVDCLCTFLTFGGLANLRLKKMWWNSGQKNNIRDVGSTADLVLVLLVHLVHWYLVHGLIGTSGALVPGTLVPNVT